MRRLLILKPPKWLKDLAGAWIFYSILPGWPWPNPNFNRIARFAPVIGLVIGVLQGILWLALAQLGWSTESLALLVIACGNWLTGGIHIDGLIDTADGLGAGKEKCHEAMKDSRIGASGASGILLVTLIQYASLIKLNSLVPFLLPVINFWARCSPFWAISNFKYLHTEQSSSFHKERWEGWNDLQPSILIMTILIITITIFINDLTISKAIMTLIPIGVITSISVSHIIGRKLGGHSGDSYGASVVITETIILFILAIIFMGV